MLFTFFYYFFIFFFFFAFEPLDYWSMYHNIPEEKYLMLSHFKMVPKYQENYLPEYEAFRNALQERQCSLECNKRKTNNLVYLLE